MFDDQQRWKDLIENMTFCRHQQRFLKIDWHVIKRVQNVLVTMKISSYPPHLTCSWDVGDQPLILPTFDSVCNDNMQEDIFSLERWLPVQMLCTMIMRSIENKSIVRSLLLISACFVVPKREEKKFNRYNNKKANNFEEKRKTSMEYSTIYTIENVFDGFVEDWTVRYRNVFGRIDRRARCTFIIMKIYL